MSTKTKLQLETELKEAQATIAKLERDLQKARASGEVEKPQREEDFLKLLEVLPVGVSILNHDRKVVFQNSALSQILHMTAEGIQAGAYKNRKYLASDGSAMPADGFASVQAEQSGQAVYNVETGIIQENGETIWTSVSAVPADLPDWKTVIVTADVTERKLLEKRLFESEKRYTLLFEKSAVPSILLKLPEVVIMDVNEAGEKLTGFSKQEMFGKTAPELGLMKPQLQTEALSQFEKQGSLAGKEILIQAKSGEERIVISNTNPVTISGHPHAITTLLDITDWKRAEEKLRQSEELYRLISENAADVIWIMDPIAGKFTYVSPSVERLRGYTPEEVMAQPIDQALTPESLRIVSEALQQNLPAFIAKGSGTESFITEVDQPCKDGSIVHTEVTTTYLFKNNGQVEIVGVSRDITERKRLEESRTTLTERLDFATRSAGIGIWDWDIKKNEIVWDDQMYALYGLNAGEFGGAYEAWLHGVHPEDQGPSNEVSAAAVRGEREYDTEFRVLWPDGSVHWLKANGQVFRDKNGTPLRMVGVNYDITERKQSEITLQESEEKYSALFAKSAVPAALTKMPEAVFVDINEAFQSVYGYSRADVIGKTSLEIGMARPAEHAQTASELEKHNFLRDNEKHLFTKTGEARIGSINVSKVKISGQDFVITTIHDITERKQSEQKLRESEVLLRQVLESIPDSTFAIDLNYRFLVDNQRHQQELIASGGNPFKVGEEILSPDYPPEVLSFWRTAYDRALAGETFSLEGSWVDANGQLHVHENRFSPLHDAADRIIGAIVVAHDITERKQAEDALRESESRLREAQRIAHIGNWEWNLQTGETRWSLENYAIHGISPDSPTLTPDALIKFVHPDDLEMVNTVISQAISQGTSAELDYRIFRPNGSMRVIHAVGEVTKFDSNGSPILMLGTNQDITERKQVEDALWKSDQRFRAAIKPSFMVLAQTDLNARYTWIHNPHPDFDSDSVLGKTDIELADNDGTQLLYQSKLRVIATGQGIQTEISFPVSDGLRVYDVIIDPFYDVDGKLLGVTTSSYDITERKRAEEKIRENEEFLRLAYESTDLGIWKNDLVTGNVQFDERARIHCGFDTVQTTLPELMKHIHPDDVARMGSEIAVVTGPTGDGKFATEYRVIHPDGSVHWLAVGVRVIFEGEGEERQAVMRYGTSLDITERKKAEENLRIALTKYQTLFDTFPLGISVSDTMGNIVETNAIAEKLIGISKEEQLQREIDDAAWKIIRPDGSPMPIEEFASVIALKENRKVEDVEMGILKSDGNTTWINVTAAPLPLESYGVVVTYADITARIQAQEKLNSSQKLLQAIIDNTPALVYTLDIDGRFLLINRPLEKLFGHTNAEMIGYRREDFVPLELAQQHRANDLEIFQSGEGKTFEEENMEPDGRHVYLTTKFPLLDANGNIYAVCGISTDMTERKIIEEELRRSNAELEQFAYIASHDLQEPLRAMAGMVQLLQKRYKGQLDERADEYIRHAVDASARMQALIQALLSYSRAQRNNQPIELVDAGTCLQIALKNLDASVQESHAVITTDALPHVHANPAQLTQLFQNLIGNGIKFQRDEEPQIHISVTKLKDAWQFSIRDNGIGIEPQYFERIFLIFQRLHTQREYSGTGIGLALCQKIIDRHDGRIWVESEPHRGSTFHFTLPFRSHS